MKPKIRPLTIDELLFDEPVKLHVPYSILPKDLPEVATAPVATPTPLKLTAKLVPTPTFLSKTGKFIGDNWIPMMLITGICVCAAAIYSKYDNEEQRKNQQAYANM